jgi:ADP-ribosylglycohydrolase
MAGWDTFRSMFDYEFVQSQEEGKDPGEIESLRQDAKAAGDDQEKLEGIWQRLIELPVRKDFPFSEPSDLAGIQAARPSGPRLIALPYGDDELYDRLYGAWLGRCAGCALGKPVEGFMGEHNGMSSKERIKTYLTSISPSEYPLNNFFPERSPADGKTGKAGCHLSMREHIQFMESDDDIRYTVIGQKVFREVGSGFTTFDMMKLWINNLPYGMVCTAETQAYYNFVLRYQTHMRMWSRPSAEWDKEIDWTWNATHMNSYREWIGAQIRADHFGYAAPGNMELAADFAWRDARMSHVKNGIYGEMFIAAMIAAAFVYDDPLQIIEAGLTEIPVTSRLYAEMKLVIEICRKHEFKAASFEAVLDEIYALLGHYNAVHTNNNAGLVVAALLLGRHDLEKVIAIAVMGGWDTDCNGATAGSIAGTMLGAKRLPAKWTEPFHDTLNSQIIGYHPIKISQCAQYSLEIAKKVLSGK